MNQSKRYNGICSECNARFSSNYRQAKTCGKACSVSRERRVSIQRSRRWLKENAERHNEYLARYRLEHAEERARKQREYYAANRELCMTTAKRYREANSEQIKEWQAAHHKKYPEKARARAKKRRALLRGARRYEVTHKDLARLLARFRYRCAYCDMNLDEGFHYDHVVPVSRGGAHSIGNLVPACPKCNASKRDSYLSVWRLKRLPVLLAA